MHVQEKIACKDKNTLDFSITKNNTTQFKQATSSCEGISAEKKYEASPAVSSCKDNNSLHSSLTKTNSSQGIDNTSTQSISTAINIIIQDTRLIQDKTQIMLTVIQDDSDIQDGTFK